MTFKIPAQSDDCPSVYLPLCDDSSLEVGDLCEGDGECGTDGGLDNCKAIVTKLFHSDVYRVVSTGDASDEDGHLVEVGGWDGRVGRGSVL